MTVEKRTLRTPGRIQFRVDDDQQSKIWGYGAVFYREGDPATQYPLSTRFKIVERIHPDAFNRALKELQDVRGLFNHDANLLLGRTEAKTMTLRVDNIGLVYEIDLDPAISHHADVRRSIERGDLTGSSFSFIARADKWELVGEMEVRTILDVDLFDVGPVTFPAYAATTADARQDEAGQILMPDAETSRARWKAEMELEDLRRRLPALE